MNRPNFEHECWLANRVGVGRTFALGTTDTEIRCDRIRDAIIDRELADLRCGYDGDEPESFRACFERLYGVPLIPTNEEKPCDN